MSALEFVLGLIVCGTVCVAYWVGKGGNFANGSRRGANGVAVPRTAMEFTYRNAGGRQSVIRASIVKVQLYPDGRLSLLGIVGASKAVREFRADRIIELASKSGQSADIATVLARDLGLPAEIVTAARRVPPSPNTDLPFSQAQVPTKHRLGRQP